MDAAATAAAAAAGTWHSGRESKASAARADGEQRDNVKAGGREERKGHKPPSQLLEKAGLGLMRWR